MTLALLIPTQPKRKKLRKRLLARLKPQLTSDIAIVLDEDDCEVTIGEKRNRMVRSPEASRAKFLAFIDDDDLVSHDYCKRMLAAIETGADVVGFRLRYFLDDRFAGLAVHSYRASEKQIPDLTIDMTRFDRLPNHLNPVRQSIAAQIGYKPRKTGEDADYARRLAELVTPDCEFFVDAYVYDYLDISKGTTPAEPVVQYDANGYLTRSGAIAVIRSGGSAMWNGRLCSKVEQLDA